MTSWKVPSIVAIAWAAVALGAVAEPVATVRPVSSVHPGMPFEYMIDISWDGAADTYTIHPARVEEPVEGVTMTPVRMESRIVDGRPVISQAMSVVVLNAGKIDLPAVTVTYATAQAGTEAPGESTLPSPNTPPPSTLTVPPFPVEARPYRPLGWFLGALTIVTLLCLGLGWRLASPHRSRQSQSPPSSGGVAADVSLRAAQKARIDGDLYAFYQHLGKALGTLAAPDPALSARIQQRTADVGYRGARPNHDLLDGDYRDVARAVDQPKEEAAA